MSMPVPVSMPMPPPPTPPANSLTPEQLARVAAAEAVIRQVRTEEAWLFRELDDLMQHHWGITLPPFDPSAGDGGGVGGGGGKER
jgi:hypothetical protein